MDRALVATPEGPLHRPIGVTILACIAFISSALITFVFVRFIFEILKFLLYHRPLSEEVTLPAYIVFPVAMVGLGLLAVLSLIAGLDLLRLRRRGMHLTLVSMALIFILALFMTIELPTNVVRPAGELLGWSICLLCVASSTYLLLPNTRSRFHGSMQPN
jgi:hypothetical protein